MNGGLGLRDSSTPLIVGAGGVSSAAVQAGGQWPGVCGHPPKNTPDKRSTPDVCFVAV